MTRPTGLGQRHGKSQMKLLLYLAAITRLITAFYLRGAAPRSAGGLLFRNTTGGNPITPLTTSSDQNPSLVNLDSSSTPVTVHTNPSDLSIVQGSLSSSSIRAVESTHSDPLTIVGGSLGLTSNPAVEPTNSGHVTTSQGRSSLGSSITESAAPTEVTTALHRPSSTQSESEDSAGPASTITHKPEPSRPPTSTSVPNTPSTNFLADFLKPSSLYSANPTTVSQSITETPGSTGTPTLDSTLSRTAHNTATQNVMSPSHRASEIVDTSLPPLTATTASIPALTSKPQTAIHIVAIDANTTVQSSLLTVPAPAPAPSGDRVHENAAENTTAGGGTSQTIPGSFTSRITASAITLSRGGATPSTILTEVPTQASPSGQIQASVTGLPRVILPGRVAPAVL